ncbi:MAG TPA: FtsQ-type POTRA domain-containing protein [Stellaceae bacterium]|nr:FtsQ-type POTRA domain-containing protein [Stellaceae bacterium]
MRFLSRAPRAPKLPQRPRPRRRLRQRVLLVGLVAAIVAGLGGSATWFVRSGRMEAAADRLGTWLAGIAADGGFAVDHVAVVGRERTTRQAILEALRVRRGTPILSVDLGAAKARLEALTWVGKAEVERQLPDTIFVRLVERVPLAFWQRDRKLVLIDRDGKIVPTDRLDTFGSLIVLVGDDAPRHAVALLDMLATEPALYPHVAAAVRVGGRRWNLRLDNGIDVALPEEDPDSAWHRLAALDRHDQLLERKIVAVDLRLPDRLVVRLPAEPAKSAHDKKAKGRKST